MAAETGFTIDGTLYEVPALDTFTMDEAQILYDYSGLTIEDFATVDDETDEADPKFKNPGFLRALMHIAYQRGNPKSNTKRVRELIGAVSLISTLAALGESVEDDAGPPALTTEPDESSERRPVESSESSGSPSSSDTAEPVVRLAATTGGS